MYQNENTPGDMSEGVSINQLLIKGLEEIFLPLQ